jgi:glycosyltransferase involved in cell wall biosynthesis
MKVLALIEGANAVCCRYRIEAFNNFLAERGISLEVHHIQKDVLGRIGSLRKAKQADAVILQRKLLPLWQILLLRNWARRLIFDVDDAVFQRDSNSSKVPESNSRLVRYRTTVRQADAVIAGNEYLRQVTLSWTKPERVWVIPTCIDTSKYRLAVHERVGSEARLTWIGQQSTLRLLGQAGAELAAIAQRMPVMEFWQICDCSADFPGFRVVLRPWSIATETADLAQGDIGIAWMPDDAWGLGKCGLKILQYMAAGLPVVANPVGIHKELVIHGQTGFLASTPRQWAESVAILAGDPLLRSKLGAGARELVEKRYDVAVWGSKFADIVQAASKHAAPHIFHHRPALISQ